MLLYYFVQQKRCIQSIPESCKIPNKDIMYNTLAKNIFRFCASWDPRSLQKAIMSDQYYLHFHKINTAFRKLLLNDYINHTNFYPLSVTLNNYQTLHLSSQQISFLHQIIDPHLPLLKDQQLFTYALFLSNTDPKFQQSKIYQHITRHYIRDKYQLLQLNLKINSKIPMWKIINHLISRLLVMRYGSTTTAYQKRIEIPENLRKPLFLSLIKNDIVKQSLLVQKIYEQLFHEVKIYYQNKMKQNLYHPLSNYLFSLISSNMEVWCCQHPLFDQQNHLIRELFFKLLLAKKQFKSSSSQAQQSQPISSLEQAYQIKSIWILYKFVKEQYEESEQKQSYIELLTNLLDQFGSRNQYKSQTLSIELLDIMASTQNSNSKLLQFIVKQILKLGHYPSSLFLQLLSTIRKNRYLKQSLQPHLQSIIPLLTLSQFLQLPKLYQNSHQLVQFIYKRIAELEDFQLTENDIINLLDILRSSTKVINRKPVRDFMFKYISDHYHGFSQQSKSKILNILEQFADKHQQFDDTGLYKASVLQQIKAQEKNKSNKLFNFVNKPLN